MSAGSRSIGLGYVHTLAIRIVFGVYGDQRRHPETTLVFFANLRAWTLRSNHNDC